MNASRKLDILKLFNGSESLTVKELSEKLNCSESSVRRDLIDLDSQGLLKKVHGGAIKQFAESGVEDKEIAERMSVNVVSKMKIGALASGLISDGDTVYLDAGTTVSFIIDEINRGEISKIFGELFYSIDAGYRGEKGKVFTQYQNLVEDGDVFEDGFFVPENVYIIGTMNDIDRSVESMDFAMRRRFAWKEIKANENTDMLDSFGELKNEIVSKMNRLNNAIWNEKTNEGIEGLSAAYHIGGAYFKKLELYLHEDKSKLSEAYQQLWENHLRGVLFEYLRGSFNAADNLKKLEEVYYSEGVYE